MRSILAARSARLVLAAAAVAALTTTITACDPTASNAKSPATPAADAGSTPSAEASEGSSGDGSSATGGSDKSKGSDTGSSDSGSSDSSDQAVDTDDAKKGYYGQSCGTNDLTFTVSEKTQAGGYFLVTAKAKPGITCELEGTIPDASFGSASDTIASNAEQAVSDTVKLSGSTAAYAGINPKTTNTDYGKEFGQLIIAITGSETDPVGLEIPDTLIDAPATTNWHANPADAVPFTS